MKNKFFLKTSLFSLILISFAFITVADTIPVHLDAFNSFIYSPSNILSNSNLSIISGSPHDTFFNMPAYSSHLFSIDADIGAENGEALLNRYSSPANYQNRDHRTAYSMLLSVPKTKFSLIYKYLYTDEYSDRFDSIWTIYRKTKNPMTHDEEGLRHEHLIMARYQDEKLLFQTNYNWYRRWNATPYFFSPILSCGYSVKPSLSYKTSAFSLLSTWLINKHSEYYDHVNPHEYTDVAFTNMITLNLTSTSSADFKVQFDPSLDPGSSFSASITNSSTPFSWNLSGSVYSNYKTSLNGYGLYRFTPNINCSLYVARSYIPQSREYTFKQFNTSVSYKPISLEQTGLYSSINYLDTLLIPFALSTWFQYNSDPIWESVTFKNDSIFIQQMPYKNSESVFGINGKCFFSLKSLHFSCSPAVMFPIGDTRSRFSLEKLVDLNLSYSRPDSNSFSASVTLQYRDRSSLNYILTDYNRPIQSFVSPSLTSLYLQINIPFIVPFINSLVQNTSLVINAGPIRISEEQRFHEHPLGNLIGPAIYAGIRGTLW